MAAFDLRLRGESFTALAGALEKRGRRRCEMDLPYCLLVELSTAYVKVAAGSMLGAAG